jgi:hypothetical protein
MIQLAEEPDVLVLGSGTDALEWWASHRLQIARSTWHVVAINNAWRVVGPSETGTWARSTDFPYVAKIQPAPAELEVLRKKELVDFVTVPEWYDTGRRTGTMLLNVLFHLLNTSKRLRRVAVACSDFYYPDGRSHFYGSGTKDPLRYGEEWLDRVLALANDKYTARGIGLTNVGSPSIPSRLPFGRGEL